MRFVDGVPLITGLVATGVAVLVSPAACAWYRRRGWVDDPGRRKIHQTPTPLAGGAAVLAGLTAGLLAGVGLALATGHDEKFLTSEAESIWLFAAIGLSLFLLGTWDDLMELRPAIKLLGQAMVALMVVGTGIRLPVAHDWPVVQWLVSAVFFLAVVNAINFLDNMNGLCAGLGCIAVVQVGLMANGLDRPVLTMNAWVLAGACLGFLPFNFPRASVFLGDAGSHLIGGLVAVLVMQACAAASATAAVACLAPVLVLAVPGLDLVQVVIGRWRRGQPIYVGDTAHVSHLLTGAGCTRAGAVLGLWAVAAGFGYVGLGLLRGHIFP